MLLTIATALSLTGSISSLMGISPSKSTAKPTSGSVAPVATCFQNAFSQRWMIPLPSIVRVRPVLPEMFCPGATSGWNTPGSPPGLVGVLSAKPRAMLWFGVRTPPTSHSDATASMENFLSVGARYFTSAEFSTSRKFALPSKISCVTGELHSSSTGPISGSVPPKIEPSSWLKVSS